ncbi:MAG: hypothetical protein Aureis2KO_32700 [Aureisphaera sp.]
MIKIEGLHKKFGKNPVLNGIDLEVMEGETFAILGPNGSGKTTLIKSILGMVLPTSGSISVQGNPLQKSFKYRRQIDYLPQIANFPNNLSVKELIDMIKDLRGNTESQEEYLIQLFGLGSFLHKKMNTLSGGTRQKVNIVLALMFDTPILVLDEPTTGLDPASLIQLKDLIATEKKKGKTILITSHIMSFVEEVTNNLVFLLEGKIYFKGTIEALKAQTGETNFEHAIAALFSKEHA